jgi:chloramphenicol 3-O phosphotransferase
VSVGLASRMMVVDGGWSSDESSLARSLQDVLPDLWLRMGVDAFIDALPGRGDSPRADITYRSDGAVEVEPLFKFREHMWRQGLATMARGGALVILYEVLLSGGSAQASLHFILQEVGVLWVGVRCEFTRAGRPGTHPAFVAAMRQLAKELLAGRAPRSRSPLCSCGVEFPAGCCRP